MYKNRGYRKKGGIRRKRISQGTWFPTAGTSWLGGEEGNFYDASISDAQSGVSPERAVGPNVNIHPVTLDYSQFANRSAGESTDIRPSLRDYTEGQDYILKSLIGNITVFVGFGSQPANEDYDPNNKWRHVQVGCGFFVARASDADQSLPDLLETEADALNAENIQNSWIFRRTWILDNPENSTKVNADDQGMQFIGAYGVTTNRQHSADATGPFFQTKSRRRIKREERLWFAISSMGWDGQRTDTLASDNLQPYIYYNLDVRLFGKMVKGRASATF